MTDFKRVFIDTAPIIYFWKIDLFMWNQWKSSFQDV